MGDDFEAFIRKNFRPLKVRDAARFRIGRLTHEWLLKAENKQRFSHLTVKDIETLESRHGLHLTAFDDGFVYIVRPEAELSVLTEFQERMEDMEYRERPSALKDAAPVLDTDLLENYRISEGALFVLTGDSASDLGLTLDSAVDFITNKAIETALSDESVKLFYEDGIFVVVTGREDLPSQETFPLHLERVLPGTEVSLDELTIEQKTAILGNYRDQVGIPKDDL